MIGDGRLLALVPARSGSKRLPGKNIRELNDKPLIAWSIEAGIKSQYVDDVVISTDSKEISNIAKKFGAQVPFLRPELLGNDFSTSSEVVIHSLNELCKNGVTYDYVLLLQPTSPLRSFEDINKSVELLLEKDANAIISVSEVAHPIEWTNTLPENCLFDGFISNENIKKRSQDFKKRYIINGAIYLAKVKYLLETKSFLTIPDTYALLMSRRKSIDIDTLEDFLIAEAFMGMPISL